VPFPSYSLSSPYSSAMVTVAAGVEPDTTRNAGRKEEDGRRSGENRWRTCKRRWIAVQLDASIDS
jgi:hypothetical protein